MSRRVVVTGAGAVTPLGHTLPDSWQAALAGTVGVGAITRFDATGLPVRIAAEVKNWDASAFMPVKEARRRDRYQQFAFAAAMEALQQSGYAVTDDNRHRTSAIIGSSVGGVNTILEQMQLIEDGHDYRRVSPFSIPMYMPNGASGAVSIATGACGPSFVLVSACATGADCIGQAFHMIRAGTIDAALAGAGDAPVTALALAAFDRTGACSRENDDPQHAVRPFDASRTGLAFGEGAGVVMLEALEQAQTRGATILAEVVGYAATSDAYHLTAPHPHAEGATRAIRGALADAHLTPEDVQYISAHGTGTVLNDSMETAAVKRAFGEHAYNVPMSSTKSMTGHCMGATAAIEVGFAVLALRDQIVPPTVNLVTPAPDCDLDYVPGTARAMPLDVVMSNAFGFGGHNASLVLRRYTGAAGGNGARP